MVCHINNDDPPGLAQHKCPIDESWEVLAFSYTICPELCPNAIDIGLVPKSKMLGQAGSFMIA